MEDSYFSNTGRWHLLDWERNDKSTNKFQNGIPFSNKHCFQYQLLSYKLIMHNGDTITFS